MTQKKERIIIKGISKFTHLITPEEYKRQKKFTVAIVMEKDSEEFRELKEKLMLYLQENKEEILKENKIPSATWSEIKEVYPWKDDLKKDEDGSLVPTGKIYIKVSSKAEIMKNGVVTPFNINFFDVNNNKLIDVEEIGDGSKLAVSAIVNIYCGDKSEKTIGISLWLGAVQIISLKTYGDNGASFGFNVESEEISSE
jgi:hypothetical protein